MDFPILHPIEYIRSGIFQYATVASQISAMPWRGSTGIDIHIYNTMSSKAKCICITTYNSTCNLFFTYASILRRWGRLLTFFPYAHVQGLTRGTTYGMEGRKIWYTYQIQGKSAKTLSRQERYCSSDGLCPPLTVFSSIPHALISSPITRSHFFFGLPLRRLLFRPFSRLYRHCFFYQHVRTTILPYFRCHVVTRKFPLIRLFLILSNVGIRLSNVISSFCFFSQRLREAKINSLSPLNRGHLPRAGDDFPTLVSNSLRLGDSAITVG